MKTPVEAVLYGGMAAALALPGSAPAQVKTSTAASCGRAVLTGEVHEGQSFEQVFTPGLAFKLEAIASGWIVRVFPAGVPRGLHDYAELATPPYSSVTPLAVSTDFSFRAQDAVGWNPRRFRYAASAEAFARMQRAYDPAMRGDAAAAATLASLAAVQPEAQLTILDAHLIPGANDQVPMAAAVASHFSTTPHEVDQSGGQQVLGRVTSMRFTVALNLRPGARAATGVRSETGNCPAHPTKVEGGAS